MNKISQWIVGHMALFVILAGAAATLRPALLAWVAPWIAPLLGLVMFGMGMTLRVEDFRLLAQRPWEVFLGALAQFTIMPLAAWALVKAFDLPPEIAVGVILLGACPGGTASNVITYLARGDVALSVAMTMTTTFLAPVVTPCLTWFLAGAWVDISLSSMMASIAQMVLAPVLLGVLVNHFGNGFVQKCLPALPLVSVTAIVLLVGGVVALSAGKILTYGALMVAVVALHNGLGMFCGYLFARLFRLPPAKTRALAIEVGMQNSGLAASLAVLYFTPAAAIPGAIFSVWHNISGSLFANFCRRQALKAVSEAKAAG